MPANGTLFLLAFNAVLSSFGAETPSSEKFTRDSKEPFSSEKGVLALFLA